MSDDTGGRLAPQQQRRDRCRELILETLAARTPISATRIARQICEEFKGTALRTGYSDFNAVWAEIRVAHAEQITAINSRICAHLDEYVAELHDLYLECREGFEPADRKTALDALKEMGKARQLLDPDRVDVTIRPAPALNFDALPIAERRLVLDGIRKARELGSGPAVPAAPQAVHDDDIH